MSAESTREDHATFRSWAESVAERWGAPIEDVVDVMNEIAPGVRAMTGGENERRLRALYEQHRRRFDNESEGRPAAWIIIEFDGDVDVQGYTFSFGAHQITHPSDDAIPTIADIATEEGLNMTVKEDEMTMAEHTEFGLQTEFRITCRILDEVYDVTLADVTSAVEKTPDFQTSEVQWDEVSTSQ